MPPLFSGRHQITITFRSQPQSGVIRSAVKRGIPIVAQHFAAETPGVSYMGHKDISEDSFSFEFKTPENYYEMPNQADLEVKKWVNKFFKADLNKSPTTWDIIVQREFHPTASKFGD